jgi:hypothetical protein
MCLTCLQVFSIKPGLFQALVQLQKISGVFSVKDFPNKIIQLIVKRLNDFSFAFRITPQW